MITAKLRKINDRYTLDIRGHAEKTEHADLVCSAASALLCTLLDNLNSLEDERKIDNLYSNVASGDSHIEFEVSEGGFFDGEQTVCDSIAMGISEGEILLFAFMRGFELLEKKYPECVSVDLTDVA